LHSRASEARRFDCTRTRSWSTASEGRLWLGDRAPFVHVVVGEDDSAGQAQLAEPGDEDAVEVDFVFAQAVEGGARIAVMVVVVAVAECQRGEKTLFMLLFPSS
jgi:hypothetical protein